MNLPADFKNRMQQLLGADYTRFCNAFSEPLTHRGVRVNRLKCAPEQLCTLFVYPLTSVPFATDGFAVNAAFKAGEDPLHHAGAYYMQEPSAMSAVTVLSPRPGETVLDLCAAPGGKTTQIAAALGKTGLLWANEYVPARARILMQNLERCGVRDSVVSCGDTAALAAALPSYFDAVLADVPCSGEGMFRKEPAALTEWSLDTVRHCAARSADILNNAGACVRPGGRLVVSTCTFAPEENELAIVRFLQTHPDFHLQDTGVSFGCPGFTAAQLAPFADSATVAAAATIPLERCRRIFPWHGGEGHFIALLVRDGDSRLSLPPYRPARQDPAMMQCVQDLYADCFTDTPHGVFAAFGDTVHLLPDALPATAGVRILSAGIAVARRGGGRALRLEPLHGVFQSTATDACRRRLDLSLDDTRLIAFLRGEELPADGESGWTAVTVAGMVTGFGKVSGGRLKNHYPKGLRLLTNR